MRLLENNSIIFIEKNFSLSSEDELLFTLCFQPFLGPVSSSIYRTFNSVYSLKFQNKPFLRDDLFKILGVTDNEFSSGLEMLEAINLVQTFRKEEEKLVKYIFVLNPVPNAKKFFNNMKLVSLLKQKISNSYFQTIKAQFLSNTYNKEGYFQQEVKFTDIFTSYIDDALKNDADLNEVFNAKSFVGVDDYQELTLEDLTESLRDNQISPKILNDNISEVLSLINVYSIEEKNYIDFIRNSISNDIGIFDLNIFKTRVFSLVKKHQKEHISEIVSDKEINISTPDDTIYGKSQFIKDLNAIASISPADFIKMKLGGKVSVTDKYLNLIFNMKSSYGFSNGAITLILDYVLNKTKKLNENYILEVCNNLAFKKYKSAYDIAFHFYGEKFNYANTKTYHDNEVRKIKLDTTNSKLNDSSSNNSNSQSLSEIGETLSDDDLDLILKKVNNL